MDRAPGIKRDKFRLATVRPYAELKVAFRGATITIIRPELFHSLRLCAWRTRIIFPLKFQTSSPCFSLSFSVSPSLPLSQGIFANTVGKLSCKQKKGSVNATSALVRTLTRSLARSFVFFSVKSAESSVPEARRTNVFISEISARHLADLIRLPSRAPDFFAARPLVSSLLALAMRVISSRAKTDDATNVPNVDLYRKTESPLRL